MEVRFTWSGVANWLLPEALAWFGGWVVPTYAAGLPLSTFEKGSRHGVTCALEISDLGGFQVWRAAAPKALAQVRTRARRHQRPGLTRNVGWNVHFTFPAYKGAVYFP